MGLKVWEKSKVRKEKADTTDVQVEKGCRKELCLLATHARKAALCVHREGTNCRMRNVSTLRNASKLCGRVN